MFSDMSPRTHAVPMAFDAENFCFQHDALLRGISLQATSPSPGGRGNKGEGAGPPRKQRTVVVDICPSSYVVFEKSESVLLRHDSVLLKP